MKNKNANANRGPGRPAYVPKIPQSKFTFADFMELNGVDFKTGKGPNCSKLTLDKWLKRDKDRKGKSEIVKLDETREPNSKSGLGRKTYVYVRRSKLDTLKSAKVATTKTKVSVNVGTATAKPRKAKGVSTGTVDYEAQKAALLAPTPAVTITPAPVETAPIAEAPAAETAPEPVTPEPVTAEATQTVPTVDPVTA
jgi:hypothetical protein